MCALLLFTGGAWQAQPPRPHCSGNTAGGRQECWSRSPCFSPLALVLVGNSVFQAGSQARKASTTALEPTAGIPHWAGRSSAHSRAAPSASTSPCPWLLLHPCEPHTALPGDRGPSHKSQVVLGDLRVPVVLPGLTAGALAKQA